MTRFWLRFTVAVFGGAALGLLVGLVARYVLGSDGNPFRFMSWGIMAGALGLAFSLVPLRRDRDPDQEQRSR